MVKNFFNSINNAIQWTKKWHFMHLFFVLAFVLDFLLVSFYLFIGYLSVGAGEPSKDALEETLNIYILGDFCFLYILFIPALVLSILFAIINFIKFSKPYVVNGFLLYNKYYHLIYIFSIARILFYILSSDLS